MLIDWLTSLGTYAAGALTVIGWWTVNKFTELRDKRSKARELRTQHLIKACRTFARVAIEQNIVTIAKDVEDAVADIYLFGTLEQVELVKKFAIEFGSKQSADMQALLHSLRNNFRRELGLPVLRENPHFLRLKINRPENSAGHPTTAIP